MAITVNRFVIEDKIKPKPPSAVKPAKSPVLVYSQTNSRTTFERPEYDLSELNTIEDVESYVRQTHRKKVGLGFKEGWDLVGKNIETLDYVKRRFADLEHAQNKPWRILVKEVFADLVKHSNGFLVKVRDEDRSSGFVRTENGRTIKPVAGYFIMAPETVELAKDDGGKVTKFRQIMPGGKKKEFSPELVVHFTLDKKTGFSMGTPILVPVKDDIRTLRRIEENIDLLVYQHLFPMFQYKVGTKDQPAQTYPDGSTEIDVVRTELEFMPPEGILVTPERHEITMVGAEGRALRAEGFLKHFKERVLAGLGTSSVDMGEGGTSNRNTADRLSDNIRDDVKAIQDDFEAQFDFFVIRELLLEGQFGDDILDPKNTVHLQFKEIDVDRQIAMENHVAQLYTQHVISEDEMRRRVGYEPIALDDEEIREKMYFSLIQIPSDLIKAVDEASGLGAAVENPNLPINEGNAKEGEARTKRIDVAKKAVRAATKSSRGQRSGASRDRPSNQNGTRTGPKMSNMADSVLSEAVSSLLSDVSKYLKEDTSKHWIKGVIRAWAEQTTQHQNKLIRKAFVEGFRSTRLNPYDHNLAAYVTTVEDHSSRYVRKLARNLEDRFQQLDGTEDQSTMLSIMDITANRINAIAVSEKQRAYNYGRLVAFRFTNDRVKIVASKDACEDCLAAVRNDLDPKQLSIDEIPPTHPHCFCSIDKER